MSDEIKRLEAELAEARAREAHQEYPKWVEPHESHVERGEGYVSAPGFEHVNVSRKGGVTVMVEDADQEAFALAEKPAGAPAEPAKAEDKPAA